MYTARDVFVSAAAWDPTRRADAAQLEQLHAAARLQCSGSAYAGPALQGHGNGFLQSGGWCLKTRAAHRRLRGSSDPYHMVHETDGRSYFLPHPHLAADSKIVAFLDLQLRVCRDPPACTVSSFLTLNDFGAGVGQYGHALMARNSGHQYRGYDGAGNVEEVSDGFVRFFDLTTPLSLPRTDWVMSLEVGEHIPARHELTVIRNLHAHNCRGLILSWAYLGKWGVGHVNNHSPRYLRLLLDELGYSFDAAATTALQQNRNKVDGSVPTVTYMYEHGSCADPSVRAHCRTRKNNASSGRFGSAMVGVRNVSRAWFWLTSTHVFRRRQPLTGPGCTP